MSVPRNSVQEWLGTGKKIGDPSMILQIYATSPSPQTCARNLDNVLLVKQILDVCVLLSACAAKWAYAFNTYHKLVDKNSPFVRWISNDAKNADWVAEYGICLLVEYGNRFGKQHAGKKIIFDFIEDFGNPCGLTPLGFLNRAWNERFDYGYVVDTHAAYRRLLCTIWSTEKRTPSWGDRMPPAWYIESMTLEEGKRPDEGETIGVETH